MPSSDRKLDFFILLSFPDKVNRITVNCFVMNHNSYNKEYFSAYQFEKGVSAIGDSEIKTL